jgi:phosphate transport system permease protein
MGVLASWPLTPVAVMLILALAIFAWRTTRAQAQGLALAGGQDRRLHSLPGYHGWHAALCVAGPPVIILFLYLTLGWRLVDALVASSLPAGVAGMDPEQARIVVEEGVRLATGQVTSATTPLAEDIAASWLSASGAVNLAAAVLAIAGGVAGYLWSRKQVGVDFRARNKVEAIARYAMLAASAIAVLTTLGIVLSLVFETAKFFAGYNPFSFLFGTQWSPQIAIRADQIGQSGAFGAVPLFLGTFLIMLIAMVVAVPIGLGSAIYLSEYASERVRTWVKPILELLAGIPTVVYGFFALLFVAPLVRDLGQAAGLDVSSQSALAAGLVMGIMIIPFISSLSDDVINAVPQALRDGSYAMGATKSETVRRVVLPAALPGIVGSVLLAISKALGETMIVTMAAGQNANLSANPLDMVTTVTVQIVMLLTGDQEYDSPKTHAAFALGFVLFFVTLVLNIIALRVVQKYREKYD